MNFQDSDFIKLLRIEANEIDSAFKKAQLEGRGTPQEVSDRRELAVKQFLEKFFPFPFRIAKGNIIDSFGTRSASIDTIILNPVHPHTIIHGSDKYSLIIADGVDSAIEVKPMLRGEELERALKQGVSIKKLKRKESSYVLKSKFSKKQLENSKYIPYSIFSTSSYSDVSILIEKIINYYVENSVLPEDQFDFICVNNNYLVLNYRNDYLYTHNSGYEGIAVAKHGEDTLAEFLLWLNMLHGSEARMADPILKHYINIKLDQLTIYPDLNEKLKSIK